MSPTGSCPSIQKGLQIAALGDCALLLASFAGVGTTLPSMGWSSLGTAGSLGMELLARRSGFWSWGSIGRPGCGVCGCHTDGKQSWS